MKPAQAHARAVRAGRILSGLAEDVDEADKGQSGGDDGLALRRVKFEAKGRGNHDKAAPGGVFFEAVDDVAHAISGVSKPT